MQALDGKVVVVERQAVTLVVNWREDLVGDPERGALAGGVITTMVDNVSAMAYFMANEQNLFPLATLDLRIEHMKPSTRGLALYVRSECHKLGRQVAFFRATVWHAETADDVIATGSGTFIVAEKNPTIVAGPP
jgi:uncharacterized protein (TIGR00369 family)